MTPEQIAKQHKKGWEPVRKNEPDTDSVSTPRADVSSPDLETLRSRFLGKRAKPLNKSKDSADDGEEAVFVKMRPTHHADSTPGEKTVIVKGGRVVGEQG